METNAQSHLQTFQLFEAQSLAAVDRIILFAVRVDSAFKLQYLGV